MKQKFVIEYKDEGIEFDVIWKSENLGRALDSFWESFDEKDRLKISDVHIYRLNEIACHTQNPFIE